MESLSQKNSSGESDPILDHPILDQKEKNFSFWNLWMLYLAASLFFLHGFLGNFHLEPIFIYFLDIFVSKPWFLGWISGPSPTTITALALMIWVSVDGVRSYKRGYRGHAFGYISSAIILFMCANKISEFGFSILWVLR